MGTMKRTKRRSKTSARNLTPKPTIPTSHPRNSGRRSTPTINRADAAKIGFGDLPAELRNAIYELALRPSNGESIAIVQQPPGLSGRDLAMGLLGTCKAVRKETWAFLYARNDFRVDCFRSRPMYESVAYELRDGQMDVEQDTREFLVRSLSKVQCADPVYNKYPRGTIGDGKVCPVIYWSHLAHFFHCTNHKRALHSMRSVSIAYHRQDLRDPHAYGPYPEKADLLVRLKLLHTRPFYSLTIDDELSSEAYDNAKRRRIMGAVDRMLRGMFELHLGRKQLCKNLMVEIAESVVGGCKEIDGQA